MHTGLIRCELTTLTPLLVGHFSYKVEDADAAKVAVNGLVDDKAILEPLFLTGDPASPVIVPGTGIKGMVRHNIGAMCNAPMERVQEQFFSYRPNLGWGDKQDRYECREAVVHDVVKDENGAVVGVEVQVLPKSRHAIYMWRTLFAKLKRQYGDTISCGEVGGLDLGIGREKRKRNRLYKGGDPLLDGQYRVCRYQPGIDGEGELNEVQDGRTKDDAAVLVPESAIDDVATVSIDGKYIAQYQRTQLELADERRGHRSHSDFKSRDRLWDRVGQNLRRIRKNQLIYVEIDKRIAHSSKDYIVSFGQHFRYRWAYADSIRTIDRHLDSEGKPVGTTRAQVDPLSQESVRGEDGDWLTMPRALFGYVSGDNPGSNGIGEGVYARLTGRIAVNHAVEQFRPDDTLEDRFVANQGCEGDAHFDIPLRILGAPKASAVEHYLEQPDDGTFKTYGDLPGTAHSGSGTPLAGRKFYRHQNDPRFVETDPEKANSNQSTLARYISRESRTFCFTVRFKDLRDWELGALLLALNPDYARYGLEGICGAEEPNEGEDIVYANKLGHGRPLGLGSIRIGIDEIAVLDDDLDLRNRTDKAESFIKKALARIDVNNTATWLKILNWKQREASVDYPNAEANIYSYHTNIRAHYSKQRRQKDSTMPEDFHEPVRP